MSKSPESDAPEPDQQVYFLAHGQEPPIRSGTIVGTTADRVHVKTTRGEGDQSYSVQYMHRSNVFSPEAVSAMAEGTGTETGTIDEILSDPARAQKLYTALGAESVTSYLNAQPSMAELGFMPASEIVGSETERSSNSWKIRELIVGIDKGIYTSGSRNNLDIGLPTQDIELLSEQDAASLRDKIAQENRNALDTLYKTYGVAFDRAQVLERNGSDHEERLTVYPTQDGKFHFTETVLTPPNKLQFQAAYSQISPLVEIIAGSPDYNFENGRYLPAV